MGEVLKKDKPLVARNKDFSRPYSGKSFIAFSFSACASTASLLSASTHSSLRNSVKGRIMRP